MKKHIKSLLVIILTILTGLSILSADNETSLGEPVGYGYANKAILQATQVMMVQMEADTMDKDVFYFLVKRGDKFASFGIWRTHLDFKSIEKMFTKMYRRNNIVKIVNENTISVNKKYFANYYVTVKNGWLIATENLELAEIITGKLAKLTDYNNPTKVVSALFEEKKRDLFSNLTAETITSLNINFAEFETDKVDKIIDVFIHVSTTYGIIRHWIFVNIKKALVANFNVSNLSRFKFEIINKNGMKLNLDLIEKVPQKISKKNETIDALTVPNRNEVISVYINGKYSADLFKIFLTLCEEFRIYNYQNIFIYPHLEQSLNFSGNFESLNAVECLDGNASKAISKIISSLPNRGIDYQLISHQNTEIVKIITEKVIYLAAINDVLLYADNLKDIKYALDNWNRRTREKVSDNVIARADYKIGTVIKKELKKKKLDNFFPGELAENLKAEFVFERTDNGYKLTGNVPIPFQMLPLLLNK